MKRIVFLFFVVCTLQKVSATDLRTDVTASNYSPTYYTSVIPRFTYKITPLSGYRHSATITIHNSVSNITQFHTDSSGNITDNGTVQVVADQMPLITDGCTAAGTPTCLGVGISGWTGSEHVAVLWDDGVDNGSASGGIGVVTADREYYPGGGTLPQPSVTYNDQDLVFSCSVGPSPTPAPRCTWSYDVAMTSRCPTGMPGPHTISITVNGVVRYGPFTIPAGSHDVTGSWDDTDTSGSVVNVVLDGSIVGSNTVQCEGDPHPPNNWRVSGSVGDVCSATPTPPPTPPAGSPAPSPLPSPPSFTPPPGGSPGPTAGPPLGSPTSVVGVSNFNDFYEPVRKAVRDSGNDTIVSTVGKSDLETATLDDGTMTAITASLGDIRDKSNSVIEGIQEATDTASEKLDAINAGSIGSNGLILVPVTGSIATYTGITEIRIDLGSPPYSTAISIFRLFVLWCEIVGFFILTVRALQYDS